MPPPKRSEGMGIIPLDALVAPLFPSASKSGPHEVLRLGCMVGSEVAGSRVAETIGLRNWIELLSKKVLAVLSRHRSALLPALSCATCLPRANLTSSVHCAFRVDPK